YLATLLAQFGEQQRALAAYNEGPGRLSDGKRATPEAYATKILWFADRYRAIAVPGEDLAPGIARVKLALASIEKDIHGKPAVALAHARKAKRSSAKEERVDLNDVTFSDLLVLDPAMTPRTARAIVEYRETKGGFRVVEELDPLVVDK